MGSSAGSKDSSSGGFVAVSSASYLGRLSDTMQKVVSECSGVWAVYVQISKKIFVELLRFRHLASLLQAPVASSELCEASASKMGDTSYYQSLEREIDGIVDEPQ